MPLPSVPTVKRYVKALQDLGLPIAGVDLTDGGIRVLTKEKDGHDADAALDHWMKRHGKD